MPVAHVEVLVEEPSMKALLQILLPKILGKISFDVHSFQCKADLLKHLPNRLAAYKYWLPNDWRILVIVDRDRDNCAKLKQSLEQMAKSANLLTRSSSAGKNYSVITRLAIEELESWYFGDWQAVRAAYPGVAGTIPRKSPFRVPDAITRGTWESFERILKKAGYFKTGLRKIEAARSIAPHMDVFDNTSHSFCVFRDALIEMTSTGEFDRVGE